ncbi:EAL domain-containing protein [Pseudocolwellia agarivorans]|uniref:two-component system response regulator n=1 Tax=Pseudocolwellia agarivorans TaxID=1911682 RepID=UPI003F880DBE
MHYEILLVDDEKSVTKALSRVLRNDFSAIHEAQSASEALTILENNPIDVVISDYRMPDVNGSELLTQVHNLYPNILNVMLSGQADMEGFAKALNDGCISKFLCKPWDNNQLRAFLRDTIKEHESKRNHDTLTLIPTLKMFKEQIKHLGLNEFNGACVALLNIQNLSSVNKDHSYKAGNKVLKVIARRLSMMFPEHIMTRVESDIFAIVFQNEGSLGKDANALLRIISTPIGIDEKEIEITGCVGITSINDWKIDLTENLERNIKHIRALKNDKQEIVFCPPQQEDKWFNKAKLINELGSSIKNNKLSLHYQPQIDLGLNKITGCEALIRWVHPELGFLTPDKFLPYIERYNLADDLLVMILDQAFSFMTSETELFKDITMSINLFASQLGNPKLTQIIIEKLALYQIPATSLELEITETSVVKSFQETREQLITLRNLGIKIAIDDFGTGHASYEYLCELPVDVVKIDGCFIKGMNSSLEKTTALNNIIATATTLSLEIVAEFVEEEQQANTLTQMGCNRLQGYWFSKAINCDDFIYFASLFSKPETHSGISEH